MKTKEVELLIGGDLYLSDVEYKISTSLLELFKSVTYKIFNLEAPILKKANHAPYPKAGPNIHQLESNFTKINKFFDINIFGLANNHMIDFSYEGFERTKDYLTKNNIFFAGFGHNIDSAAKPVILENEKIVIVVAGEEEFGVADKDRMGILSLYSDKIIEIIDKYSRNGYQVISYIHGGGEEIPFPSEYIKKRYRELIDAGSVIVIGHHPHVVQGKEHYKGKLIYYSIGNFIHSNIDNYWGLLLKIILSNNGKLKISEIPFEVKDKHVKFIKDNKWKIFSKLFNKYSDDVAIYDEQSLYMYKSYYINYFNRVAEDKRLLMHLIRNNSHRDFINHALKIVTGEINDSRSLTSHLIFKGMLKLIK